MSADARQETIGYEDSLPSWLLDARVSDLCTDVRVIGYAKRVGSVTFRELLARDPQMDLLAVSNLGVTTLRRLTAEVQRIASLGNPNDPERFGVVHERGLIGSIEDSFSAVLDAIDAHILFSRFAVRTGHKTLEELGGELNLTRERVRQREARALKKVKKAAAWMRAFIFALRARLSRDKQLIQVDRWEQEERWLSGINKRKFLSALIALDEECVYSIIPSSGQLIVVPFRDQELSILDKVIGARYRHLNKPTQMRVMAYDIEAAAKIPRMSVDFIEAYMERQSWIKRRENIIQPPQLDNATIKWSLARKMWGEGKLLSEIAQAYNTTENSLGVRIVHLRKLWDWFPRRREWKKKSPELSADQPGKCPQASEEDVLKSILEHMGFDGNAELDD